MPGNFGPSFLDTKRRRWDLIRNIWALRVPARARVWPGTLSRRIFLSHKNLKFGGRKKCEVGGLASQDPMENGPDSRVLNLEIDVLGAE